MFNNQAAFLDAAGRELRVGDVPMPIPRSNEIVIRNCAVAINPVDWHMRDTGIFMPLWPGVLGCDVAGEVHDVGAEVTRFKKGDRVLAHTIALVTGNPRDGAFQLFSIARERKAAILPASIAFTAGAAIPMALETAVASIMLPAPAGVGMFGLPTPTLGLPLPALPPTPAKPTGKTLVVYGASSSVGSMATQLATAGGTKVVALASAHNHGLATTCGASEVFDHHDPDVVARVVASLPADPNDFAGILDTVSTPDTYERDLEILAAMGGGRLATVHPPPEDYPDNVDVGFVLGVNDFADRVWTEYVTPALREGRLKALPRQEIVGKGLKAVQEGLRRSKEGVSATKLVVDLS